MNKLSLNEVEPRDQTYRFIRDDPDGADAKVFVEHLWEFFCRYTGDCNFNSAIASSLAGVSLEECIQEHKARRRVKHGDVPQGGEPI